MKIFLAFLLCVAVTAQGANIELSLAQEAARSQERGLSWLLKQQEANGSWRNHPAITALAATSLLRSGQKLTGEQQTAIDRAVAFVLSNVKSNGAIYGGDDKDKYPNYSTAICLMALQATGDAKQVETIRNARKFLLGSQFDEGESVDKNNPSYGGIGYGRRERPDLSNMQWALDALRLTESLETQSGQSPHVGSKLHWEKAVAFLQRCQNLPAHNDQPWAKNPGDRDLGGFIYMPGVTEVEEGVAPDEHAPLRSYGSMSYAGLKSYIYAELKKDDPRVVAAVNWLRRNYTVDENPALGQQGYYYYVHTMAKALTVYGDDVFVDAAGKKRNWRTELTNKLVSLQKSDGFWINENNRWWENDPVLVTSYSLLALEIIQAGHYP